MVDTKNLHEKSNQELTSLVLKLQQEKESLNEKYNLLLEQFKLAKQKRFAHSSEKCPEQVELFDEVDVPEVEKSSKDKTIIVAEHERKQTSKPKREVIPEHFERERIVHDIAEADKVCDCGCQKQCIGEDITEQMEVIPPQFKVSQHVRPKYACKACNIAGGPGEGVAIAPYPKLFLPKSMAGPSLVAYTISNKYIDHLPLYRQETIWNRHGLKLPRNTLCGWVMAAYERVEPLLRLLRADILGSGYIQADETTVQVMKEKHRRNQQKSYMWSYRGNAPNYTAILYEYQETRAAKHVIDFLEDFKGYLQTDGYKGYDWVNTNNDIVHLGCFAHARRPFAKLMKVAKTSGQSDIAIELIQKLYAVERQAREEGLSHEQRHQLRQEKSKPVLDELLTWIQKMASSTSPKSVFGKGIIYIKDRWEELTNFLRDGKLEIDNNAIENNIRPFALGRNNWKFKGSPRGARAGACFYSLIETCKANNVEPFKYLNYLFLHIPQCQSEEDYRKLLPYNLIDELATV